MMNGMGGWWMGVGWLVIIGLIVLVVLSVARHPEDRQSEPQTSSAAEILADRFARGEIDEAEYRTRLDALGR
jgi:putative membrane protein